MRPAPDHGETRPGFRRLLLKLGGVALTGHAHLDLAWLWPVYTYELLTTPEWLDRIWFRSWI